MAKHSNGGKGSKPRPFSISQEEFDTNWNNIFKKDRSEDKNILNKPNNQTHTTVINTNTNTHNGY